MLMIFLEHILFNGGYEACMLLDMNFGSRIRYTYAAMMITKTGCHLSSA